MNDLEWFVLALLSAVFAAFVSIFAKMGLNTIDPTVATAVRSIIMTMFIVVFVSATGKGSQLTQLNSRHVGFVVLSGISGALSWLFYFAALKLGDASKVAPIDKSSMLMIVILAALFLGEKITLKTGMAEILIFTGILLLP